jgi:hypothetical protein
VKHRARPTARRKAPEPIPEFRSREEEAEFWDTHDLADYWDQFKPIEVRFSRNLSEPLTVRLDPTTLAALRSRAKEKGVAPSSLARIWLLERLQVERGEKPRKAEPPSGTAAR